MQSVNKSTYPYTASAILSCFLLASCSFPGTSGNKDNENVVYLDAKSPSYEQNGAGSGEIEKGDGLGDANEETEVFKVEIRQLTDDEFVNYRPVVSDSNVAWTQFPTFSQQDLMDVYVLNTVSGTLRRVGYVKEILGNVVDVLEDDFIKNDGKLRGMPKLGGNYLAWIEMNSSSRYDLFYTGLGGKLQKNLIATGISSPAGIYALDYPIDDHYLYYRTPASDYGSEFYNVFDLANDKLIGSSQLPEDIQIEEVLAYHKNKIYCLGTSELYDEPYSADMYLISVDLTNGKVENLKVFEDKTDGDKKEILNSSIFRMDGDDIYWTEYNKMTKSNSVLTYNLITKQTRSIMSGIKGVTLNYQFENGDAPYPNQLAGFDVSGRFIVWAITYAENPGQNGLFVLNMDTGKILNVLADSDVKLVWDLTRDIEMHDIIDGNKLVFMGYTDTLLDDYSNAEIYLAEISSPVVD